MALFSVERSEAAMNADTIFWLILFALVAVSSMRLLIPGKLEVKYNNEGAEENDG